MDKPLVFEPFTIEYTLSKDEPIVHIFGRTQNREWLHLRYKGFKPYFYVLEDADIPEPNDIIGIQKGFKGLARIEGRYLLNQPYKKVFLKNPKWVNRNRRLFKTHGEADCLYPTRFMLDKGISHGAMIKDGKLEPFRFEIEPRIWIIDIECAGLNAWTGNAPVSIIGIFDTYEKRIYHLLYHPKYTEHKEIRIIDLRELGRELGKPDLFKDKYYGHEIYFFNKENRLFSTFVELLREKRPDILNGYNILKFDAPTIIKRMEFLGMNPNTLSPIGEVKLFSKSRRNWAEERSQRKEQREEAMIRGLTIIDSMKGYKKIKRTGITSGRLDDVGRKELGIGKFGDYNYVEIIRILKEDPLKLLKYNIIDILIVDELNKQFNIINYFLTMKRLASCEFSDSEYVGRVVDRFLLQWAHQNNIVLPSRPEKSRWAWSSMSDEITIEEEYTGGYVAKPEGGLWTRVAVFDLKSIYPIIMMAWNISPETLSPDGEISTPVKGVRFTNKFPGLLKSAMQGILEKREEYRKIKQKYTNDKYMYEKYKEYDHALKVIGNAFYGICAYDTFRLYHPLISATITAIGRNIIMYLTEKIDRIQNLKVCYSDTDSLFIRFDFEKPLEEILSVCKKLTELMNKVYLKEFALKYNAEPILSIKLEKLYSHFGLTIDEKKKRYFGHIVWRDGQFVDDYEVKGFEYRRGDASWLTKKIQMKLIQLLCEGASWEKVRHYILTEVKKLKSGKYTLDQIGIPRGLSKELDEYKHEDVHIRGIRYAIEHLKLEIPPGVKAKRVYISRIKHPSKFPSTDVICFLRGEEVPKDFEVDYERMCKAIIEDKVRDFIMFYGKTWEDIIHKDLSNFS